MSVKFRYAGAKLPLILVPALVLGKKPKIITALIDTGATSCVMSESLFEELGLKAMSVPKKDKQAHGVGGAVAVEFATLNELMIGTVKRKNFRTAVMNMNAIQKQIRQGGGAAAEKIEMIIGTPFFKNSRLEIDYGTKTLDIKPSAGGKTKSTVKSKAKPMVMKRTVRKK